MAICFFFLAHWIKIHNEWFGESTSQCGTMAQLLSILCFWFNHKMAIVFSQVIYNVTPGYVHTASKNVLFYLFLKIMFTNLVSTFVLLSEGCFFLFFTAPGRLAGRGLVCGRWLSGLCQWNGWGALIRQTTQRAGTLITLCGAVWQQAQRRGKPRRGYIHIIQIFTTVHVFYCDYCATTCTFFVFCCRQRSFPPLISFLLLLLLLVFLVISYPLSSGWHSKPT